MSVPGSASHAAVDRRNRISARKRMDCIESVSALLGILDRGIRARDIATKEAFENAIAVMMALGGSTNGVLHILALAHEAKVPLALDDFHRIGQHVPLLGNFKPFGTYVMSDLDRIGGLPMVMKTLLRAGLLHGECLTVTGKTVAENLSDAPTAPDGQDILFPPDRPYAPPGRHITAIRGNLAPEGAVLKLSGKVIYVAPAHMIVEITGKQENIDSAIKMFEEFGIAGIARTGATVMHREEEDMGLDRIVPPARHAALSEKAS